MSRTALLAGLAALALAPAARAHCDGHGPKPKASASAPGVVRSAVVLAADAEKGAKAEARFDAELLRSKDAYRVALMAPAAAGVKPGSKATALYFFGDCSSKDYEKRVIEDPTASEIRLPLAEGRLARADRIEVIFERGEAKYVTQFEVPKAP